MFFLIMMTPHHSSITKVLIVTVIQGTGSLKNWNGKERTAACRGQTLSYCEHS
jgi:hypothetical protein